MYVNSKQYQRILIRRVKRALQAQAAAKSAAETDNSATDPDKQKVSLLFASNLSYESLRF